MWSPYLKIHPGPSFVCILRASLFNIKKLLQRNSLYLNPSVHKSSKLYLKLCSGTWQEIRCFCKWTQAMRLQEVTTQTSCAVVITGHTTFSCSWKIKEEEIQAHMFQE